MARRFGGLILLAAFLGAAASAQESSPSPSLPGRPRMFGPGKLPKPDQFEEGRRIFDKMSPEERQRFRQNLQRWDNLPPGEQERLRNNELTRREKIAQQIDEAIQRSGLKLDAERREVYALRYAQERRRIEARLRKEMEDKRKPALEEVVNRLKAEFSAPAAPSTSASP